MTPNTIDLRPRQARLLAYAGDPFDFHIRLTLADGGDVDVADWEWRATVQTGYAGIDFEWEAEPSGVHLWLRGEVTARIGSRDYPYDVTGRHPQAGEGVTVLRGVFNAARRITVPLRSDPDLVPAA